MTNASPSRIAPGCVVTLHFSLSLPDGTVALSTFGEEPMTLVMGDGTLLPGLELALYGMKPGDAERIILTPEQTYGFRDPRRVHEMSAANFPPDITPETGQIIAFSLPDGEETPGSVLDVAGDRVKIDFNHPLAGHDVEFRATIISVAPPTTTAL